MHNIATVMREISRTILHAGRSGLIHVTKRCFALVSPWSRSRLHHSYIYLHNPNTCTAAPKIRGDLEGYPPRKAHWTGYTGEAVPHLVPSLELDHTYTIHAITYMQHITKMIVEISRAILHAGAEDGVHRRSGASL